MILFMLEIILMLTRLICLEYTDPDTNALENRLEFDSIILLFIPDECILTTSIKIEIY